MRPEAKKGNDSEDFKDKQVKFAHLTKDKDREENLIKKQPEKYYEIKMKN